MSIIKELDDWLNDSEIREKEININETTIFFTKMTQPDRINVSIVKQRKEITTFNYCLSIKPTSAISLLRCSIQIISYNAHFAPPISRLSIVK